MRKNSRSIPASTLCRFISSRENPALAPEEKRSSPVALALSSSTTETALMTSTMMVTYRKNARR